MQYTERLRMQKITIFLWFVVFILIVYSCVLVIGSQKHSIEGTYCTLPEEDFLPENLYLSVFSDGTFVIYRQNEEGVYGKIEAEEYDHIAALEFIFDDNSRYVAVYDFDKSIIFLGDFIKDYECPLEFKKISNTPLLINVKGPEGKTTTPQK